MIPLAHAGPFLIDLAIYGTPVAIAVIALKWADRREARSRPKRRS